MDDTSSIIQFLQRPERIFSGRITPSTPSLQRIGALRNGAQVPIAKIDLLKDALTQSKLAKLDYYKWLKCDVKLRILIAANPFVAGRLLVTTSPQENVLQARNRIVAKGIRALTSYPSLEIDLQSSTAAEYTVPWCGTNDAVDLTLNIDSTVNSSVFIWLMSPLSVASNSPNSNVPIQVYASLTNIELRLPTPHQVARPRLAKFQVNTEKEAPGPITEISSKIARAAGYLKNVPVIGSVASTTEWIANLTNGVASIFGWSRPIVGPTEPVANIPGRGFNNFKSDDAAVVLGMHSDNSIVESHELSPQGLDEMQVSFAVSRPGLVNIVKWDSNDAVDAILSYNSVSPDLEEESFIDGNRYIIDSTIGDYIFNKFGFWRADTHYRISIIKTQFHVGRLEVFYNPFYEPAKTADNIDTTNCYREIFDITDKDEIEFVIPYMHSQLVQHSVGVSGAIGYLQIRVVAPLTAPDTVSSSIYLHVWKWYENACVAGASGLRLETWDGSETRKAVLQVNTEREEVSPNVVFGATNSESSLIDACSTVCGEMCVNLRESTRSFREASKLADSTQVITMVNTSLGGYLEMCSNIYAFYRGGLSFKIIAKDSSEPVFSTLSFGGKDGDLPSHFTASSVTPIHEVSVPYYTGYRRVATNTEIVVPGLYAPTLNVGNYAGEKVSARWFVGGKDDLNFSYLIGPATLTLNYR